MTSKHIGPKLPTTSPDTYASEQNEAPERNLASDYYSPASLDMLYPNLGVIEFSDDLCMVDIPGLDQDINILWELTLANSLASENLSIEVCGGEDIEGV